MPKLNKLNDHTSTTVLEKPKDALSLTNMPQAAPKSTETDYGKKKKRKKKKTKK
jgi:hypothetical protein